MQRKLRLYTGVVLVGVPVLTFLVIFTIAHCYLAFLMITDQPIQRGKKDPLVFSSRIDTKIKGDEYFVKFPKSRKFQKVTKSSFYSAIEREKEIVRNSYIFTSFFMSFFVGFFLLKSTKKHHFYSRDTGCPDDLLALKSLSKERGITF